MRSVREHYYFPPLVTILRLILCCIFFPENSRSVMTCSEVDFVNSCQSKLHRETVLSKGDFASFIESYCPSIYQKIKFRELSSSLQKDFIHAVCYNDIYNNGTDCIESNDQLFPSEATISKSTSPSNSTSEYNETITFLCRNVYNDLDPTCHHMSSFTTTANHSKAPSVAAATAATPAVSPMASPATAPSLPSKLYNTNRPTKTTASIRATPTATQTDARTSPTSSSVISSRESTDLHQPQEYNNNTMSSNSKALHSSIKIFTVIAVIGIVLALLLWTRQRRERKSNQKSPEDSLPPDQQLSAHQLSSVDESAPPPPSMPPANKREAAFRKTLNILKLKDMKRNSKGRIDPILLLEASSCASSISSISEDQINFLENLIDFDDWMPFASAGAVDPNKNVSDRPKLLLHMDQNDAEMIDKFIEEGDWDALAEIAHEFKLQNNRLFDLDGTASSVSTHSKLPIKSSIRNSFDLDRLLKEGDWDTWAAEISALELNKRGKMKNIYSSSDSLDSSPLDSSRIDNNALEDKDLQEDKWDISISGIHSETLSRGNPLNFNLEASVRGTKLGNHASDHFRNINDTLEDMGDILEKGGVDGDLIGTKHRVRNSSASRTLKDFDLEHSQHCLLQDDVASSVSSMYIEVVDVQVDNNSCF